MIALLALALAGPPVADHPCELPPADGPTEIYLVSVTPGWTAMSSLGHTLILVAGGGREDALTYNWGAFDTNNENLASDFMKGELPYFLATWTWPAQREVYLEQGRGALAQRLDLHDPEGFVAALEEAAKPENAQYTYDWRTANCSTKARDFLDEQLDGSLAADWSEPAGTTPRTEIRRHLGRATAQDLSWSFVAGSEVDEPLTEWERALFPDRLMESVAGSSHRGKPLVDETCLLLPGRFGWAPTTPPPTWPWMVPGLLFGWLAVSGAHGTSSSGRWLLAGSLLAQGVFLSLLGTGTMALWATTSMRAAGPTTAWLLAGPHSLLWLLAAVPVLRARAVPRPLVAAAGLSAVMALIGLLVAPPGIGIALAPGVLACAYAVARYAPQPS